MNYKKYVCTVSLHHVWVCLVTILFCGVILWAMPVRAQIETIENGGIIDGNTQKDDDDDDEVDLDKSKYKPSGFSAEARNDGAVRLTWDDEAKGEDGYKVQRRADGGGWESIADLDNGSESHTDRSAKNDTVYQYRVRAYNASSETDYSSVATVTTVPPDPQELLAHDIVKKEIDKAVEKVELTVQEKQALILNLEDELRKANDSLEKSTQELTQTQACDISVIPEEQIQKEMESRCEAFPGSQQIGAVTQKTGSLISQIFGSTKARIIMSVVLLLIVVNNVLWHITHKSVRKELHFHRNKNSQK